MGKENTCCFFGHRNITKSQQLKKTIYDTVKNLISTKGADTFLFGSKSKFDELCHEVVTELKKNTHT